MALLVTEKLLWQVAFAAPLSEIVYYAYGIGWQEKTVIPHMA